MYIWNVTGGNFLPLNDTSMEQKKDRTVFYVVIGIIAILVLVFILQNREAISIRFLGLSVDGPRYLVYLILFGLGFFSGWLWRFLRHTRKEKSLVKE